MARYISMHTLACLTRQGAEALVTKLQAAPAASGVRARRVLLNMQEGKMLVEFEALGREELERWLGENRFHFDWLLRMELEATDGPLQAL